ncbi:glycosyltransferase [Paenibacillus doosanensis]|uniref:CgeB family protein n=1 Tax=Paenibacillus doosanensis TaxID=1229154 RepID=UPI002180213B|nr:glycosyltransferase [Paenibacillus doosanensis]MCS7458838.1 glycosyltransferase [Paenibacillus doosanensis]
MRRGKKQTPAAATASPDADRTAAGAKAGRGAGRQLGWSHGYHLGRCEAIRAQVRPAVPAMRNLRVLYIPQGFHAIDHGIIGGLQHCVRELIVGTPQQMLSLAEEKRPDVLLVLNGLHVFPNDQGYQVGRIRELGIRTVIWFVDDPYFTDDTAAIARFYDVVLTHEQSCVSFYAGAGCRQVGYLPLAADTELFRPQHSGPEYRSDICFIGMAFWNRAAFFDRIAPFLATTDFVIAGGLWDRLVQHKLLRHRIRDGYVPIEETVKYYSGAKIVINLHRFHSHETDNRNSRNIPAHSVNPRTYEMAACGALQLTDGRSDLPRLYVPGQEINVYHSPEDLIAKLKYYLSHESERQAIAYNALKRTLRDHSFMTRMDELLSMLGY